MHFPDGAWFNIVFTYFSLFLCGQEHRTNTTYTKLGHLFQKNTKQTCVSHKKTRTHRKGLIKKARCPPLSRTKHDTKWKARNIPTWATAVKKLNTK